MRLEAALNPFTPHEHPLPRVHNGSWSQKQYRDQLDFVAGSGSGQRKAFANSLFVCPC